MLNVSSMMLIPGKILINIFLYLAYKISNFYFSCSTLKSETYDTFTMFERFCVPQDVTLINKLGETFSGVNIESILEGIANAKSLIFFSIILAFISSFLFSFLLETCAGIIITITVVAFYAGLGFLTYVSYVKKNYHLAIYEKDNTQSVAEKLHKFFKVTFWILVTILSISICVMVCLFSRVVLAVKVIKVSTHCKTILIYLGCC